MKSSAADPPLGFRPKILTVLQEGYSLTQLGRDIGAGVIVGIVALPLAIAFAIASGVPPERGLYTAVVAGFLISALGGSRVQIGGPTGAFIVIVYRIVQQHGYEGLAVATLMAGILLILMGLARLGSVIKFIPYPLTVGFTGGIALIIAVSQTRDLFGLQMEQVPADFVRKLMAYGAHMDSWNPYATLIAAASMLTVIYWSRISGPFHRIPGPLIAILGCTALVQLLGIPVETIGDRFGAVPTTLPQPSIPLADPATLQKLFAPAFTIALLSAIESLLSAVVADGMIGGRHRSNTELIAQGIANVASPIFGGIPATGAIARTATNIKTGGRTPVAGITHALTLLLIMQFFGSWASLIPIAALAGILLVVAYNMSEWRMFVRLLRSTRSDVLVLVVTFLLTVLIDLTVALEVGMVLAAFLFMGRMANLAQAGYVSRLVAEEEPVGKGIGVEEVIPPNVEVFEIQGPFFFGAASKFKDALLRIEAPPAVLVLRLREVASIDATAVRALEDLVVKTERDGTALVLSGVREQPRRVLERTGLAGRIGEANLCSDIRAAIARAHELLGKPDRGGRDEPQDSVDAPR